MVYFFFYTVLRHGCLAAGHMQSDFATEQEMIFSDNEISFCPEFSLCNDAKTNIITEYAGFTQGNPKHVILHTA
jgi:hypothetical protein